MLKETLTKLELKLREFDYLILTSQTSQLRLNLQKKLEDLLSKEENLWRQKSREILLKEEDKDTKFFHASAIHQRKMNKIDQIKNDQGEWFASREAIGDELCRNVFKILTSKVNKYLSKIKNLIKPSITAEDNLKLTYIPAEEEIK